MVNLRALALVLAPLAACSSNKGTADAPVIIIPDAPPDAKPIDAAPDAPPNYDFSCLGNNAPTTATDPIVISGTTQEVVLMGIMPTIQAAPDTTVDTCKGGAANCMGANQLDTTSSGTAAAYATASLPSAGVPLDAYLVANKTGDRTTIEFPAAPFTGNADVPIILFGNLLVPILAAALGTTQTMGDGLVFLLVEDCSGTRIDGATVILKQGGNAVGVTKDAGALNSMGKGTFITFSVPPGDTDVTAMYNGMAFRTHTIKAVGGATSATIIQPGFAP